MRIKLFIEERKMEKHSTSDFILWDKSELSKRLGRSISTISKDVMNRKIPFVKIGRHTRFRPTEIEAWIESQSKRIK